MKSWFKKNTILFESFKREVEDNYPFLRVVETEKHVFIKGTYELIIDGLIIERLQVFILIPDDFPRNIPVLFEVGGKYPVSADRHFFPHGKACLFVEEERFKYWPGDSIKDFIDGPIRNFFLSQVHFEKTGKWPFGERSHDQKGIMEFYQEYLDIHHYRVLLRFLEYFSEGKVKGSHLCPCGSGKIIRKCKHYEAVFNLNNNISRQVFKSSLKVLERTIPA